MSLHFFTSSTFQRTPRCVCTYPGLTAEMLAYEISVIRDFVAAKRA
jgi:hypothetical protein